MTNPPDWKQDQAETSRLPRKDAQTMLAELANWLEHAAGFYSGPDQQEKFMNYARVVRTASAPAVRIDIVADAIDYARYQSPAHPRERPRPFCEADDSDREYAYRLAKAVMRALATSEEASTAAGEATTPQADYVKDICKRLRAGHQYSGIVDPLDMVAANLIEALYLTALPSLAAPPAAKTDTLSKRPVAFLVVGPNHGDHLFLEEDDANKFAAESSGYVHGMYVRDGTPLLFAVQTDGVREALEPFVKPMSRMAAAKMIDPTLGPMTPIDVVVTKHQFASAQIALSVTRPGSGDVA